MRLVFVTQQVDPAHPALAATVPKIRALAERVDELVVLADGAAEGAELPANCRVRLFAAPTRAGRGLRFARALAGELRRPGEVAVVAHMCPIYAVLAAPLARPRRARVVLWFTHWKASRLLQVAAALSNAIVTVDRRSFPLDSGKVRPIGHGIDLAEFPCRERAGGALRLLALGRYSPAKGLETIVRAVALVEEATLAVHGPALTAEERAHREELTALVAELGVGARVSLEGAVPRAEVPGLLADADALVNNMRAGAPDKVVYEAAASCVPVLASNPVFDTLLPAELRFARDRPDELAERLRGLAVLPAGERAAIGHALREQVERAHSVASWADGVLTAARR